jgi:predicted metal-dependent phosphoesterase TrpH
MSQSPHAYGRADLHLHTRASDGLMSAEALVDYVERRTALDVIAITDHDEVTAALRARDRASRLGYRVQVIPGIEVTTRQGHLLALFLEVRPPAFRSYEETAEFVLARGGLCIAPHPFARITHSVSADVLACAVRRGLVAALEVWNPSPAGRLSRSRALRFASEHRIATIGASDAHWARIVGMAHTLFPGTTPADLRSALEQRTAVAEGRFARALELAVEAVPQTIWATGILPLRKLSMYARDLGSARGAVSGHRSFHVSLRPSTAVEVDAA